MGRLDAKHWAVIAGFIAATGTVFAGLHNWAEVIQPAVVAGLLGQVAVLITSVFVGAPENPNK